MIDVLGNNNDTLWVKKRQCLKTPKLNECKHDQIVDELKI